VALGTAYGSHHSNERFFQDVLREGAGAASPSLFTYTLPSAATGELSIHFGLAGPAVTLAHGAGAGLSALGVAARAIATGEADLMLAGGADTIGDTLLSSTLLSSTGGGEPPLSEGAALCVLSAHPTHALARVGGQAERHGEGALARAIAAALDEAGVRPSDLARSITCRDAGCGCGEIGRRIGRCSAAAPVLGAVLAMMRGQLPALITVDEDGLAGALCLVPADTA
jgi:3-oxoacyl-[acyl-carrier-protein] synthase II